MGIPAHGLASARSEVSIAALVFAKQQHARTGLVRAIRGEGGLAPAGMAKKASGGRLQRLAPGRAIGGESGPPRAVDVELVERRADAAPYVMLGHPIGRK